jgi:methylglutaconyl-CoA hydratase
MTNSVLTELGAGGIATIRLNRPQVHNAIDESVIDELSIALDQVAADDRARVIVLTGNGESFCAGADLHWMKRTAAYDEEHNYCEAAAFASLLARLREMPKASIARVQGPAYGGGVGLVAACDIAIGARGAMFSFSEVRLGLIPAMISPYAVAVVGERYARRYMLSAERIDAEEAARIGLLHELCDRSELDDHVQRIAGQLLRGGPAAIAECKQLIAHVAAQPNDAALREYTARAIARVRATSEGKEGVAAFLEKRPPAWTTALSKGPKP